MRNKRRSLRLQDYDYAQNGFYFVTICVRDKRNVFGDFKDDAIILNNCGLAVECVWMGLERHYCNCRLDEYVLMPDHMHGIIEIVGAGSPGPCIEGGETPPLRIGSLSDMMGYFKYHSTKRINECLNSPGQKVWQRGFYDHIIRNENDLNRVREYICNNPREGIWKS